MEVSDKTVFPTLKPLLNHLYSELKVGLKEKGVTLKDFNSGLLHSKSATTLQCFDRFKVSLELAGDCITWEVLFDQEYPNEPPDVIFGSEDQDFCPDLDNLQSFQTWDHLSPASLADFLTEIVDQYLSHQKECLLGIPRLKADWEELVLNADSLANTCEVHILKNGPGVYNSLINFMFNLPVDLSQIPAYLTRDNPGRDQVCLHISFQPPNLTHVQTRLLLSPRVEHALGGRDGLRIPMFGNSTIYSYVRRLELCIKNSINDVCEKYVKRKELIATFMSEFPGSVIEYDPDSFYELILLLQLDRSFFVLFVMLGNRFPAEPPTLVLQSIVNATGQGPYRETRNDFKYSPRWESLKIVEKIREYLTEIFPIFQQNSRRY